MGKIRPSLSSIRTARPRPSARKRIWIRYAQVRGREVVDRFRDEDRSASKNLDSHKDEEAGRKEFRRLLAAIRDKQINGVIGWKFDRLTRNVFDYAELLKACKRAGAFILTMDGVDTRESTGQLIATVLTGVAEMESTNTSIRVKRKNLEWVKEGRPHTGGYRAFGYTDNRRGAINVEEAEHIRAAASRLLNGESVRAILRDWASQGILAPGHKTKSRSGDPHSWTRFGFKPMITSAALSGQREHNGVLTPGNWPAILTPADTEKLRLLLNDPARKQFDSVRTYLLSGMVRCGQCGQPMQSRPYAQGKRRYRGALTLALLWESEGT
ncbi:MAG: hypothetical protein FJ033_13990 [Chloroflexi bacterium]|nr:hypothetical protein [Chloroflexota bacterium]